MNEKNEKKVSFEGKKLKEKLKKKRKIIIISGIAVVAVIAAVFGVIAIKNANAEKSASILTYDVSEVTTGSVSTSISGSGNLTPVNTQTITSTYTGSVVSVKKSVGDSVEADEIIAVIESDELESKIDEVQSNLNTLYTKISNTSSKASSKYIKSTIAGTVKLIKASEDSSVEDVMGTYGYLCLISTDGKMKLTILATDSIKKYDTVTVEVGGEQEEGTVTNISGSVAAIEIDNNTYTVGSPATVYSEDGTSLGEGNLSLVNYVKITASDGTISSVLCSENETVSKNSNLFLLEDYPMSSTYASLLEQKESLEAELDSLKQQMYVSVDFDGVITELPLTVGEDITAEQLLATVESNDGYEMTITVDELDISSIEVGQTATITLDSIDGTFDGTVSYISYEGTANNSVTTYSVTITVPDIEGALPGMSASCEITTDSSGDSLLVPVDAVYTSRDESYIYLAPSGLVSGDELESNDVDLDSLTKVTVETGMSDGIYIVVTGEGLSEGDLILVPVLTTTEDGSSTEEETRMGNFGGMSGDMSDFGGSGGFSGSDSMPQQNGQMPNGNGGES
ncbi:MAG: HlyD family efflux transporter periplasmic adaptor subunit [Eubacteriales bacterium]